MISFFYSGASTAFLAGFADNMKIVAIIKAKPNKSIAPKLSFSHTMDTRVADKGSTEANKLALAAPIYFTPVKYRLKLNIVPKSKTKVKHKTTVKSIVPEKEVKGLYNDRITPPKSMPQPLI